MQPLPLFIGLLFWFENHDKLLVPTNYEPGRGQGVQLAARAQRAVLPVVA
jgi:hypothetical protein